MNRLKARLMHQVIKIFMNRDNKDVLKIQFRCSLDGVKKINGEKAKDISTFQQIKT